MATILGVPYFEYVGPLAGIGIIIMIVWFLLKNSDRWVSLEKKEMGEDRELLKDDKQILRLEREKRKKGKQFYKLLTNLNKASLGHHISREALYENSAYIRAIERSLNELLKGKIGIMRQKELINDISQTVDKVVTNLSIDNRISDMVQQVQSTKTDLVEIVTKQIGLLQQKEGLLRTEFQEIRQEEAA